MNTIISFKGEIATKCNGVWCYDFKEFSTINQLKGYILKKIGKPATAAELSRNHQKAMQVYWRKQRALDLKWAEIKAAHARLAA